MAVFSHICRTGAGFITKPNKRLFPSPVLSYIESHGPDKCFNCREPIIKQFCNSPAVFRSIVNIKPLPGVQFVGALSAIFHSPFFAVRSNDLNAWKRLVTISRSNLLSPQEKV